MKKFDYIAEYVAGNIKPCPPEDLAFLFFVGGVDVGYPSFRIRIFTDGVRLYTPDENPYRKEASV